MSYTNLLETLNQEEVDEAWESLEKGELEKEKGSKYYLIKGGRRQPFKSFVYHLAHLKDHSFHFTSSDTTRDRFCDLFDFDIDEELSFTKTEESDLKEYIKSTNNDEILTEFTNYISQVIDANSINPYKIRAAITPIYELVALMGKRKLLALKSSSGESYIRLYIENFSRDEFQGVPIVDTYDFKSDKAALVKIKVNAWNDVPKIMLERCSASIGDYYNRVKDQKVIRWQSDAGTTNSAFKYLMFNPKEINKWLSNHESFFDLDGLTTYKNIVGSRYSAKSKHAEWYKNTVIQLENLSIGLGHRLVEDLTINYRERPNIQAGRAKIVFKDYLLLGFVPRDINQKFIFIKMFIHNLSSDVTKFGIEIDIDEKIQNNPFLTDREYLKRISRHEFPLDENFPNDFHSLVNLLEPIVLKCSEVLRTYLKKDSVTEINKSMELNQILYGPPGTGKTYSSIAISVAIVEDKSVQMMEKEYGGREAIKKQYNKYVSDGRIVFTTFHQSLNYEDFIEGIKPKTEKGNVIYEIEDGIFKELCQRANPATGNFDLILETFKKDISEPDGRPAITITSKSTKFDVVFRGTNVFYVQPHNSQKDNPWYPVNIQNIRKVFETDSYEGVYNPTYVREILSYLKENKGLIKGGKSKSGSNYVLIIDEINRGNVSQIFGELITLIEKDKRLNSRESLTVTLPYSKLSFGVPNNVFIIGTMNTADKSVEALDAALRRRFSFVQVNPMTDMKLLDFKINGIHVQNLLNIINERITYLKDEDHQIGHSYFIGIDCDDKLKTVFKKNIIPLLKEYFYNDTNKIRSILGEGFVEKLKTPKFAVSDVDEEFFDRYRLLDINDEFNIVEALSQTMNQ